MAGAGAPFYIPLLWPVGNLVAMLKPEVVAEAPTRQAEKAEPETAKRPGGRASSPAPKNEASKEKKLSEVPKPTASPELDLVGHLTSFCGASRSFLMACGIIYGCYDGWDYPAFGRAKILEFGWMWPIIVRNVVATWLICGCWDYLLYFGFGSEALKKKLHKYKYNPQYPSMAQIRHDAIATTIASLTAAAIEIACCHLWCTGALPAFEPSLSKQPLRNFLWAVTITHWRIPHFWLIHRMMHPWKTTAVPDFGKVLYKYVHAMHHKSYNPTAFSGTNMHPVESTLYYSASLIAVAFGCHPAIALGCIIDCGVGAWLGHDGFQWPGQGDYFHYLHHAHFDCNYGAIHVPIDKWLGTYIGQKEELKKVWGNMPAGAEANEHPVHPAGKAE